MNPDRPREPDAPVALTYDVVGHKAPSDVLFGLEEVGLHATFFVDPVALVGGVDAWRRARASGHAIGDGCLSPAALPDGSLPLWTLDMVASELDATSELFAELGLGEPAAFVFPGPNTTCARGTDYGDVVRARRDVCVVGEASAGAPERAGLTWLPCMHGDDLPLGELLARTDSACSRGGFAIWRFRQVGAAHSRFLEHVARSVTLPDLAVRLRDYEVQPPRSGLR